MDLCTFEATSGTSHSSSRRTDASSCPTGATGNCVPSDLKSLYFHKNFNTFQRADQRPTCVSTEVLSEMFVFPFEFLQLCACGKFVAWQVCAPKSCQGHRIIDISFLLHICLQQLSYSNWKSIHHWPYQGGAAHHQPPNMYACGYAYVCMRACVCECMRACMRAWGYACHNSVKWKEVEHSIGTVSRYLFAGFIFFQIVVACSSA